MPINVGRVFTVGNARDMGVRVIEFRPRNFERRDLRPRNLLHDFNDAENMVNIFDDRVPVRICEPQA